MNIKKLFLAYGNLLKNRPIPTQAFQTGMLDSAWCVRPNLQKEASVFF